MTRPLHEPEETVPGRPRLTPEQALEHLRKHWDLSGTIEELPSDRDRNFRVLLGGGESVVLKFVNSETRGAVVAAQVDALRRAEEALEPLGIRCPEVQTSRSGATTTSFSDADGRRHQTWLVRWIDGTPFAECTDRPSELLGQLGRTLAACATAFEGLTLPTRDAPFDWDPLAAPRPIERGLALVSDAGRRTLLTDALARFRARVDPHIAELPHGVIHGDANDWNLLVRFEDHVPRLAGLLDFGDLHETARVCDLAIAAAYAMLDTADPVDIVATLCAAWHGERSLDDRELEVVWELARTRLATSVSMAAWQRSLEPDNEYLSITEAPAWRTLEATAGVPPRLAIARIRAACQLEPCAAAPAVRAWLDAHAKDLAPVLGHSLEDAELLDLAVGSPDVPAEDDPGDVAALDARLRRFTAPGAERVGLGRYAEPRLLYATSPAFATPSGTVRTVHLGADLFAPARNPVHAPLDAVVESVATNDQPLDYGPTVILRHAPADGPRFWTLFGHLAADSVATLRPGQVVARGEAFAALGTPDENGGWPPHLHLQVIADLLDLDGGDFPGVAAPEQAATWLSLSPDPSPLLGRNVETPTPNRLHARRRALLGPSLSLSYRQPLHIVRGRGQYLFDHDGRRYLDLVNNVCHVGHCHPKVVEALTRQARILNTNTRYLHDNVLRYAEKLLAKFPANLDTVFFVNSGSEANDLAMRMMRTHTGGSQWICVDAAYHGHTAQLIDVSPYKHDAPGGSGSPAHVATAPLPDIYRGAHRGEDAGTRYAEEVVELIAEVGKRGPLAGFLCESILSCGGQIPLPPGYLEAVYATVRAQGGLCLADEVQVGFGRVGDTYWGFELQGVVPDVVTLGKPIGNGHPLAAVVTTRAIAESFDNGMEYFNTFGGNPVSAAVGEAVLDVIEAEALQERAKILGTRLLEGLRELQSRYATIGDVRGRGLFLGLEFVTDRESRNPDAARASLVVDRLMRRGFLLSTDGPQHNVIKIKPPLVIEAGDIDALLTELDAVLRSTRA